MIFCSSTFLTVWRTSVRLEPSADMMDSSAGANIASLSIGIRLNTSTASILHTIF